MSLSREDIRRLILSLGDDEPVRVNYTAGYASVVRIQVAAGSMTEVEVDKLLAQIEERAHWGTLEAVKKDGALNITFERTVQK